MRLLVVKQTKGEKRMNANQTARVLVEKGWWVPALYSDETHVRTEDMRDCIIGMDPDGFYSIGVWTWEGKPLVGDPDPAAPPLCDLAHSNRGTLWILGIAALKEAEQLLQSHSDICRVDQSVPWEYAVNLATGEILSEKEVRDLLRGSTPGERTETEELNACARAVRTAEDSGWRVLEIESWRGGTPRSIKACGEFRSEGELYKVALSLWMFPSYWAYGYTWLEDSPYARLVVCGSMPPGHIPSVEHAVELLFEAGGRI
jgi:hypothetical protein